MEEACGGDEESMIPKGLLDVPWERTEEMPIDNTEFQTSLHNNTILPCLVTIVPQEYQSSLNSPNNYVQNNDTHHYPIVPQPIIPNYSRLQGGDYCYQYQRNGRAFNVLQPRHSFQDLEYTWCNHNRPNQNFISFNSGIDLRTCNSRNNTLLTDRVYIPLQPISSNRYSFEYQQKISNTNSYSCLDYEVFPNQIQGKTLHKSSTKIEKESQTDEINLLKQITIDKGTNINEDVDVPLITQNRHKKSNFQIKLQLSSSLYENAKYNHIEKDTFRTTSYLCCLQLEELITKLSNNIPNGVEIAQICSTLKSDLTKPNTLEPNNNNTQDIIAAFLQISFSWVYLNKIKIYNQNKGHTDFIFDALNDSICKWEINSKNLIENLIIAMQSKPFDECRIETPVIKILKNNLNHLRSSDSEISNGHAKKRFHENDSNCLNYNWRKNSQTSIKESDKSETVDCFMCQLIPESHKSNSESNFVFDNFMQILKKTQEKNSNKNYQRYTSQKSKDSLRGRFTIPLSQNSPKENMPRNDTLDRMYPECLKKSKIPLLSPRDNYQTNTDFSRFNKLTNIQKLFDENRNVNQHITDKYNEKQFPFERIQTNNPEGINISEIEKGNKQTFLSSPNNAIKTDTETNRSENSSVFDKGKGKRYSQQYKKKNNFLHFQFKQGENNEKIDNTTEMNSYIKLKLYEIFMGIQMTDLTKITSEKLDPNEVSTIQKTLIDPINGIAQSLIRNCFKTVDQVVEIVLSSTYQAKIDNKGNMMLLTMANQLEIKLINAIYLEIGTA